MAAWQPIVRNFASQDYDAGTQNWQVQQAENGWMLMANNQGLLEYDGCTWRLYGVWHSSPLLSIAQGDNGIIYAGGSNELGYFRPTEVGMLTYRSLVDSLPAAYRNFGEIRSLHYDDGNLYVQARLCLFVINASGHVDVVDPACVIFASIVQDHCLYLSTSNGLYLYSGKRLHTLRGSSLLDGLTVSAMTAYDEHSFLIATDFAGIFRYDGTSLTPFLTDADGFIRRNQLYSLAISNESIALGTVQRGAVVLDKQGHNPVYIGREQGLQNNTVLSLTFDSDQNLWLGLDQGASLALINSPLSYLRYGQHSFGTGYAFAEYAGNFYYGTNQGIYMESPDGLSAHLLEGSSGQVWRLVEFDGTLFCCHNRGLFEVNGPSLRRLDIPEGVWNVLPLSEHRALACTYGGLYLLTRQAGRYQVDHAVRGYDETVLFAYLDAANRLWTISQRGVERITFNDDYSQAQPELMLPDESRSRYSLAKLGEDVLVMAEGYMASVQTDGSLLETDSLPQLLSGKHKYEILRQAPNGTILYMFDGRMHYRSMREGHFLPYSTEVLNDKNFFVGGFANISFRADGLAVIGGVHGFYMLGLRHTDEPSSQAHLYLRSLENKDLGILYGERTDSVRKPVKLSFGRYMLRVNFGTNLVNRQGAMYQSRLLPDEKEFSEWSSESFRDFALLHHGTYTLEVRMHLTDAEDAITSLQIEVARPWYATWWAIILYVLLIFAFFVTVWFYARFRIRRSRRQIEAEKAAELHQQEKRILQLESEQAQFDLKEKSRELNSALLNQVNRNELNASLQQDVRRISDLFAHGDYEAVRRRLQQLEARLSAGNHQDKDWKRFEENFDFVNDRFIRRLSARFPWMSKQEKKLCVYIYMGLQTKEIAPLLGLSTRGVEMMRYRMRKKMELPEQENLKLFFDSLLGEE